MMITNNVICFGPWLFEGCLTRFKPIRLRHIVWRRCLGMGGGVRTHVYCQPPAGGRIRSQGNYCLPPAGGRIPSSRLS